MQEDIFKNILATTASASNILQFFTGILVCQKIVRNKSTGDLSPLPFVSGYLSTGVWLRYGFLIQDSSVILVNTIGLSLFLGYVITFGIYSLKKTTLFRQFLGSLIVLISTLIYIQHSESIEIARKHLGLICTIVTVGFFAAPLVSILHVFKVRSTESLPFPIILSTFFVSIQWFFYGVLLGDPYIQIPNLLGFVIASFQLILYCVFANAKGYSSELI